MNIYNRRQAGFGLLESIIAIGIITFAIGMWLVMQGDDAKFKAIQSSAADIGNILNAVGRRTHHDGFDFSLFDENGIKAPTGDNLTWDKNTFKSDFIGSYLQAHKSDCGTGTSWNPKNDDGSLDGGTETKMDYTNLLPCEQFRRKTPFNLEFSSVLSVDTSTAKIDKFKVYIDFKNSSLYSDKNISDVFKLKDNLDSYIKSKQMLKGIPFVNFGTVGNIDDPYDDTSMSDITCAKELAVNRECTLIIGLDFTGTTNSEYLQVDGGNSMLASVKFASSNTTPQRCIWWQSPNKTAAEQGDNAGGVDVSMWTAKEVMCGISGGNDSPIVEAVINNVQTNGLVITNPTNLNHMCKVYQMAGNGDFVDPASDVNDGSGSTVPCGIMANGDVIQLAVERAYIGQAAIKDLVAQDAFTNTLRIKHNPSYNNNIETGDKGVNAINGFHGNPSIIFSVEDSTSQRTFSVYSDGYTDIRGDVSMWENAYVGKSLMVGDSLNVNMNNNGRVDFGSSLYFYNRDPNEFDITTSRSTNLQIVAEEADIQLGADKVVSTGAIYSTKGYFNNFYGDPYSIDMASNAEDFKVATMDYIKHLESRLGTVSTRSTVPVGAGAISVVSKPDCFDFVKNNPLRYAGKAILDRANADEGYDLARIIVTPLYNKSFSQALGDNQVYSQHVVDKDRFTWEAYLYLTGEGVNGTGGREDDIGAGIATIQCDYTGIDFTL